MMPSGDGVDLISFIKKNHRNLIPNLYFITYLESPSHLLDNLLEYDNPIFKTGLRNI